MLSSSVRCALGALAATLAVPAAAQAQLPWAPCQPAGFECATVEVPLDRAGAVPGTLRLATMRARASSNPRNVAVLALAGGPGQAATPLATDFASALSPALADRDLLVVDQRGTGASGSLTCPALAQPGSSITVASRCAQQIGAPRGFFRTVDSVADIEAVRAAAGYEKLVLYGVSYGTKVALQYAAAFPARVESLVLDSVVLPEGPDPLRVAALDAVPRVLQELCAGGECRGATPSVGRDVRRLASRLRRRSLRGSVVDSRGRRQRVSMGESGLFEILLAGDLNPAIRAEFPGSARAALTGDSRPLLRLAVRSAGLEDRAGYQAARADSRALFLATVCEEAPFRWTRNASVDQRAAEITAAARSIPSSRRGPFGYRVPLQAGVAGLCLGWPEASAAPQPAGPLPAVPTLVLNGRADLRTPLGDAQQLPGRIPGAQVVGVPFTGHSVLGSDLAACSGPALRAFFAGQPVPACTATDNPFSPTPKPPRSLRSVRPLLLGGTPGRTLGALRATILDARRQVIGATLALGTRPPGVGGLRGGSARVSGDAIALRSYQYVSGVRVSGTLNGAGAGTFRVRGSGARGTVTIAPDGALSGRLGGRTVRGSFASAASRDRDLPTLREVLALPGIR